jgi:hypothetical protein
MRFIGLCVCLLAVGCAGGGDQRRVIGGQGDFFFPGETLTDWVSYALQVSEVTVLSDEEVPPSADVLDRKEGYVARRAHLRVDNHLWVNADGFAPLEGETDLLVVGWILKGERLIPFVLANCPRLEVGGHYVMPLTRMPDFPDGSPPPVWGPLTADSVLAVPGDAVAEADVAAWGNFGVARAFSGRPLDELREALARTPMDPIAAEHRDLLPYDRFKAVQASRRSSPD